MKQPLQEALRRFWIWDRGLSLFFALLIVYVFVLPAFGLIGPLGSLWRDVAFSALLVVSALSLPDRRWMRWIVPPTAALALLMRWTLAALTTRDLAAWHDIATLITLALFAWVVAAQVYRSGPVTYHRIQGAVAVYMLLGLTWASAYQLLFHLRPDAFTGNFAATAPQTWIYFSFVTLTTTGYGDISPVHPVARSLANAEAITGQLYLAVTLARLVALQVSVRATD